MADLQSLLQEVYDQYERLTPPLVVDSARPVDSELHHRFEWDDSVAGEKYRETQAAQLIRSVRLTHTTTEGEAFSLRAFHSVPRPSGRVYEPIDKITEDPISMKILLGEMERDFAQMKRRYRDMEAFWDMLEGELDERS